MLTHLPPFPSLSCYSAWFWTSLRWTCIHSRVRIFVYTGSSRAGDIADFCPKEVRCRLVQSSTIRAKLSEGVYAQLFPRLLEAIAEETHYYVFGSGGAGFCDWFRVPLYFFEIDGARIVGQSFLCLIGSARTYLVS